MLVCDGSRERTPTVSRVVRDPFLYFLLIGVMLFVVHAALTSASARSELHANEALHVDEAMVRQIAFSFRAQWGNDPDSDQVRHLVDQHVQEELLLREALASNLHLDDSLVRRHLSEKLDMSWSDTARAVPPSREELSDFFERNESAYRVGTEVTFSHRYFDAGRRDAANDALIDLVEGREVVDDQFSEAKTLTLRDLTGASATFGEAFSQELLAHAQAGRIGMWVGPLRSQTGWHLVRIESFILARQLEFEEALAEVERDWREEFVALDRERRIDDLYQRYSVSVADFGALVGLVAE